ncbi:MAG: tetratricopeptide repeat protein [Armatimonadetes bacterium]|nr:tetratricopeptide repeat protein [Armatimonadota bacterium]
MWPFRRRPDRDLRRQLQAANEALRKRDLPTAITAYREVLAADPENLSALMNLGTALHLSGQHTAAIECFEQALQRDPANATAYVNLGAAHGSLGHLDRAMKALLKALDLAPMKRDIHYNLATLYLRKGEVVRAMAELELELAIHPDHVPAQKAVAELRRQQFGTR